MKILNLVSIVVFIFTSFLVNAQTLEKNKKCEHYAKESVRQNKENISKKYGLKGPEWSSDYNAHKNWCLHGDNYLKADQELARRESYLNKYLKDPSISEDIVKYKIAEIPDMSNLIGLKERISEDYAKKAVYQNQENISNGCGFKGPEWSSDYNAHKNWCLHGDNYLKADQALNKRESQLKKCLGKSNNLGKVNGAILNVDPNDIVFENNIDRPGKNYKKFDITEAYEFSRYNKCLQACIDDPKCKSFTFVKSNTPGVKDQCFLKNEIPDPVQKENCVSGVVRPESKNDYCKIYASNAIYSATTNIQGNCGNKGNRWTNNYKSHYDFCMKVPVSRSKQEASERNRLLAICNKPTKTGDLMAYDMCYDIDFSNGKITFYPIIKNVGSNDWRSEKEGQYVLHSTIGPVTSDHTFKLSGYPHWSLKKNQTSKLQGISFSYSPHNTYRIQWRLSHNEDTNSTNNSKINPFDPWPGRLEGIQFGNYPWLQSHKACHKTYIKYKPLNIVWNKTDLNNIPLNPKTEWQLHHYYGQDSYYPRISYLLPLLQKRFFKVLGGNVIKLGEERDFSFATDQQIFKEYGSNYLPIGPIKIGLDGVCGPHVNWRQPVTYEGYLFTDSFDSADGDINFYLRTPKGAGSSWSSYHTGEIKIEFNVSETINHFHTPIWQHLHYLYSQPVTKFSDDVKNFYIRDYIKNKYTIVTALYGYDCAHECFSELHPAWTMAIRMKDDPNDDIYAIFARNWGNEGFCSDHYFFLNLPKEGNKYIYKFLLPWRPKAESVNIQSDFKQRGDVSMDIKSIKDKGIIISFGLSSPDKFPRINGELHLHWNYPPGISPQPYPELEDTDKNASSASKVIVLEDSEMVDDIIKKLPQNKRQIFRKYIDEVNKIASQPDLDESKPKKLNLNHNAIERINSEMPEVQMIKDMDKYNRQNAALKKLSIDKELIERINSDNIKPKQVNHDNLKPKHK